MTKKEAIGWYESLPDDIRMKLQNEFDNTGTPNCELNFFKWLASFSKKKQKELNIQMEIKVGTRVKLPFGETGTVKEIITEWLDWYPYKVRIRKAVFNKTNQILDFKKEQLEVEE